MKVCVAGCSVSDRYEIKDCYGDFVSRLLEAEYLHLAASSGSNERTWRLVTDCITKGLLTKEDLLIVQYTEVTRTEFWYEQDIRIPHSEPSCDQGSVIKFKINHDNKRSSTELASKEITRFYQMYRQHFLNKNFEQEKFRLRHSQFQCMLLHYDIATVFIDSSRIHPGDYEIATTGRISRFRDSTNEILENNLSSHDLCHFSQEGARLMADQLVEHIRSLSWLA